MRKFGAKGSSIIRMLIMLAAATAIPLIALRNIFSSLLRYSYILSAIYTVAFVSLSAIILHRKKSISGDKSLEIRTIIYISIMAAMVIMLEIH